ncbi:MAG: hypothetical protein AAF206_07180 [Bacteroidota bacterium]
MNMLLSQMKKLGLCLPLVLLACQKPEVPDQAELQRQLIGRWEVTDEITATDSISYVNNPNRPCAYALLPYDYNSGFELWANGQYELIWCSNNKSQFAEGWFLDGRQLHFPWPDQEESVFDLLNLHAEEMILRNEKGVRYHLRPLP